MIIIADEVKLHNDALANTIVSHLQGHFDDNVILYYQYPIYRGDLPEDIIQAQLLLVSASFGVVYIMCKGDDKYLSSEEKEYLDSLDANIYKKFLSHPELRLDKRHLKFEITGFVLGNISDFGGDIAYVKLQDLIEAIEENQADLSADEFDLVKSCIDNTTRLSSKKARPSVNKIEDKPRKGEVLNVIQNKEACLDQSQRKLALSCIDGPQRIRGLAGSGKTIILTMKAALFHLANPDAEILYTYYTKDLYELIHQSIERFYREAADNHEPNWKKIHILHAWGGGGLPGVYSTACSDLGIQPITFQQANERSSINPFDYVCSDLIARQPTPKYDLTLIDEGQDFHKEFYQLCYHLTKDSRIVWAYDEFQNIFDVNLQDEKETFGKDNDTGLYRVDFSRLQNPNQDIILKCCYRNPRNLLIAAFALGLGIYNEKVLQCLPSVSKWESLGFKVEEGSCQEGDSMVVSRPVEFTPSVSNTQFKSSVLTIHGFSTLKEECRFVAKEIINDIQEEGLLPDDICVICLDKKNIENYYINISMMLSEKGIMVFNMLNASYTNTRFIHNGTVTLATLNKAKGNEAGMVYIVGCDTVFSKPNNIIERNRLFTALTRAKGWAVATGAGEEPMSRAISELNKLIMNDLLLKFIQPSEEQTKTVMRESSQQQEIISGLVDRIKELKMMGFNTEDIFSIIENK